MTTDDTPTEDEAVRSVLRGHLRALLTEDEAVAAVLNAAGVPALRRWKDEALPVMAGLQELGRALGLGLGSSITGETAAQAARDLRAEVERLRTAVLTGEGGGILREAIAQRDRALADLRGRVEALLTEADAEVVRLRTAPERFGSGHLVAVACWEGFARDLRAALAGDTTEAAHSTASSSNDGVESDTTEAGAEGRFEDHYLRGGMSPTEWSPTSDAREDRHFAPYGSTNARCDETVPRSVAWDAERGEYGDDRFTVERKRTTCRECLWRLAPDAREDRDVPREMQVDFLLDVLDLFADDLEDMRANGHALGTQMVRRARAVARRARAVLAVVQSKPGRVSAEQAADNARRGFDCAPCAGTGRVPMLGMPDGSRSARTCLDCDGTGRTDATAGGEPR